MEVEAKAKIPSDLIAGIILIHRKACPKSSRIGQYFPVQQQQLYRPLPEPSAGVKRRTKSILTATQARRVKPTIHLLAHEH